MAGLRVGNLPTGNLLRRRLGVRFVCYHIVIKSLSFRYQMGLTPHRLGGNVKVLEHLGGVYEYRAHLCFYGVRN